MLSFTTDPYHPGDNTLTREVLMNLQAYGMGICTLTKGGKRALRDIWLRKDLGVFKEKYVAQIPSHGAVLLLVK